jgi:hypothetical protein
LTITMTENHNTIGDVHEHGAKKGNWFRSFFRLGEVGGYFFRRKDPSRPSNINIRMMHGINKISIVIFLLGVLFIILKRLL